MSHPHLRVVVVSPVADLYGSTLSQLEVLGQLDGEVKAIWVVPERGPLTERLERDGGQFRVVGGLRAPRARSTAGRLASLGRDLPAASMRVARIARHLGADLIHSNSAAALAGAYGAGLARLPHLWHVREVVPDEGSLAGLLRRQIPARSDAVVFVSRAAAAGFATRDGTSSEVIHDAVALDRLYPIERIEARRSLGIPAEALVVGSSGYLNPRKGMDVLLEAYAIASREISEATRLVLAGRPFPGHEGFAEGLTERASELEIADELLMPGYLPEIGTLLSAIDAFALVPREPEGLGRSLIEAMALSVPGVGAAAGGILDVIDDEASGLLVPPNAVAPLAEALGRLLSDERLRERLGAAGAESARTRFEPEARAADLLRIYRQIARTG